MWQLDEIILHFVLPDGCKYILNDIEGTSRTMQAAINCAKNCNHNTIISIISEWTLFRRDLQKISSNEVFVFPQFEGKDFDPKAFEHIKLSRAIILGPRCLLDCFTKNIPIPRISTPLYTFAMRDMVIKKNDIADLQKPKVMHFEWVYEVWEKSCHDNDDRF
uniref:CSON015412 protein n=1 Tax=Culicoides sonorensis TaxID=179676 RepID=A0A336LP48_CULSO